MRFNSPDHPGCHGTLSPEASDDTGLNTPVLRRALLPIALVATIVTPALGTVTPIATNGVAAGRTTSIVPGITYAVIRRPGPQVLHVVTYRANARLRIAPVQASGLLTNRATLTSAMQARLAAGATAGINADYFNLATGTPSGVLAIGTGLLASPEGARAALTIGAGGILAVGRLSLSGRYQALDETGATPFPIHTFRAVNRPLPTSVTSDVVVYTPDYGAATPALAGAEVTVALDDGVGLTTNTRLMGTVIAQTTGGGSLIAPGQVVISGTGESGTSIVVELPIGARVEIEAAVPGIAPDVWGAVGGGPMIVEGGIPVSDAGEGFTRSQRTGRTTRTAVGQTADGAILMVVSEGPQQGVRGYSSAEQGVMMASLGAIEAIGFDSGGSSLMAIGQNQLIPWSRERRIADALVAYYAGAQLSIPTDNRVTPNGDGVADQLTLGAQSPVAGRTVVTITSRDGGFAATPVDITGDPAYTPITIDPSVLGMADGPYTVTTFLTPLDSSEPTSQARQIVVDGTLGSLRVASRTTSTGTTRKVAVATSFTLSRPARVTITVATSTGRVVATIARNRSLADGRHSLTWRGMIGTSTAPVGGYSVTVLARGPYGQSGLRGTVRIK